jgi:hypothetical protein
LLKEGYLENKTNMNTSNQDEDQIGNNTNPSFIYPIIPDIAINMFIAYLSVVIVIGILGNGLILAMYISHKNKMATDWYFIFVAIFDLAMCVCGVPVQLSFQTKTWYRLGSDAVCRGYYFLTQSLTVSSMLILCLIAVERYIKLCKPSRRSLTAAGARKACTLLCAITAVVSLPAGVIHGTNEVGRCAVKPVYDKGHPFTRAYYLALLVAFIFMFVIVGVSYTFVGMAIFKNEKIMDQMREQEIASHVPKPGTSSTTSARKQTSTSKKANGNNRVFPGAELTRNITAIDNSAIFCINETFMPFPSGNESQPENDDNDLHPRVNDTPNDLHTHVQVHGRSTAPGGASFLHVPTPGHEVRWALNQSHLRNNISRRHKTIRATKLLLLVTVVFVVSWIPPWIVFIGSVYLRWDYTSATMTFYLFGGQTNLLNHFLNPILYTCVKSTFRDNLRQMCSNLVKG